MGAVARKCCGRGAVGRVLQWRTTQNANPKGVTLTATAEYAGKTTVRVKHVLVYRDTKLVSEVWQIDPSADLTPVAP